MRKRKRQTVKKLIQCVAIIAAGVLAIILFMLAIWYRGKNSEPVTDEQVAAQMQQAEPLVIETPEAAAEGSIRVYDYDGCCIYAYYGKIQINNDGIGSTFAGFGKNMIEGIWNGISGATRWIKDKISDWVGDVTGFLKDLFGIASPSKLMRDEVGVYLAQGIGVGFSNEIGGVKKMIEDSVPQEFDVDAKVNIGNEFKYDNDDKKPKPRGGGSAAGGVVVNQYIYANTTDYAKQQKEAARQFRMIARTV